MRLWLIVGAVNGFVGVSLGAFAAHVLRERLEARSFEIWEVAVRYQMYHALALVAVGLLATRLAGGMVNAAGWCFLAGIVLFSGSLYALVLSGVRVLGAITPLGGVAFLIGWALLGLAAWRGWASGG